MNRLPLVLAAVQLLAVTTTLVGPDSIEFPASYNNHVHYATYKGLLSVLERQYRD
jgi:hypothetical protein